MDWAERMAEYVDLLGGWNDRVNLVSRRSMASVVGDQIVPSLAALLVVPVGASVRVLDVGSGGGFPGIPLGILRPEARIDLVEATRNKCDFLEVAAKAAGLRDARVHWCRIERPSESLLARRPFDVAFARAVGTPTVIARGARPLLAEHGSLWTFVGPDTPGSMRWPQAGPAITALRAEKITT
ncbi:MAG: RsmG family class I SAM-dependent methyltransferase [bacterium]